MTSLQNNIHYNSLAIERWLCYSCFCLPCCFRQLQFQQNNRREHNAADDYCHQGARGYLPFGEDGENWFGCFPYWRGLGGGGTLLSILQLNFLCFMFFWCSETCCLSVVRLPTARAKHHKATDLVQWSQWWFAPYFGRNGNLRNLVSGSFAYLSTGRPSGLRSVFR